ncbi:hypothetical protein PAEPH01_1248 [Pancytospora epiphaga]|nr:hypothetical protein PAEPH01_1248 [Pancytospora epiphaga]
MKSYNYKAFRYLLRMPGKQEKDLEQLLKIADDSELKKLLGVNPGANPTTDINTLRIMWKKEKNRIAAKKSREKRANLMVELEKKELHLANEVGSLRRFIMEYDVVVESLLRYIKYSVNSDWVAQDENTHNRGKQVRTSDRSKEAYKKLVCCLEYLYHVRSNELPDSSYGGNTTPGRADGVIRLINEIIYTLKAVYSE